MSLQQVEPAAQLQLVVTVGLVLLQLMFLHLTVSLPLPLPLPLCCRHSLSISTSVSATPSPSLPLPLPLSLPTACGTPNSSPSLPPSLLPPTPLSCTPPRASPPPPPLGLSYPAATTHHCVSAFPATSAPLHGPNSPTDASTGQIHDRSGTEVPIWGVGSGRRGRLGVGRWQGMAKRDGLGAAWGDGAMRASVRHGLAAASIWSAPWNSQLG